MCYLLKGCFLTRRIIYVDFDIMKCNDNSIAKGAIAHRHRAIVTVWGDRLSLYMPTEVGKIADCSGCSGTL